MQLGGRADFLCPFIWNHVSGLMQFCDGTDKEQRVCIKCCANLGKNVTETLAMIRQAFREKCMSCTQVFEWKSPN
jgi:hypothetical protein